MPAGAQKRKKLPGNGISKPLLRQPLVGQPSLSQPPQRGLPVVEVAVLDSEPSLSQPLRGVFSAEEVATLDRWLPKYLLLRRSRGKKFMGFWEPLVEEFFELHPLPPLTPEDIANGVEQGDRKGERMLMRRKVCEPMLF